MKLHPSWRGGNLSRSEYWSNAFLFFFLILVHGAVITALAKTDVTALQQGGIVWNLSLGIVVIGLFYFTLLWNICRVRDFGYGWPTGLLLTIACGIPIIGLAFLLLLGFYPSKNPVKNIEPKNDEGINYNSRPEYWEPSLTIKILFVALLLVFGLSMV